jgi:hypothetical protein
MLTPAKTATTWAASCPSRTWRGYRSRRTALRVASAAARPFVVRFGTWSPGGSRRETFPDGVRMESEAAEGRIVRQPARLRFEGPRSAQAGLEGRGCADRYGARLSRPQRRAHDVGHRPHQRRGSGVPAPLWSCFRGTKHLAVQEEHLEARRIHLPPHPPGCGRK